MLNPAELNPTFPPVVFGGTSHAIVPLTMRGFAHWRAFEKATLAGDEDAAQRELLAAAGLACPSAGAEVLLDQTPTTLLAIVTVSLGKADEMFAALEAQQAGNAAGTTAEPAPASTPTPSAL